MKSLSASFPAEKENIKREDQFSNVPTKGTHNPYNYEASGIFLLYWLLVNYLFLSVETCHYFVVVVVPVASLKNIAPVSRVHLLTILPLVLSFLCVREREQIPLFF